MSGAGVPQRFWGSPIRYLRWAAHEKPAIFWSVVIGLMGPASFVFIPPLRRLAGDVDPPRIPLTYPGEFSTFSITSHAPQCISFSSGMRGTGGLWEPFVGGLPVKEAVALVQTKARIYSSPRATWRGYVCSARDTLRFEAHSAVRFSKRAHPANIYCCCSSSAQGPQENPGGLRRSGINAPNMAGVAKIVHVEAHGPTCMRNCSAAQQRRPCQHNTTTVS